MTEQTQKNGSLQLSALRALLGNITSNVGAVIVGVEGSQITLAAFYIGPPTENDREGIEDATTLIIADYAFPFTIRAEHLRTDALPVVNLKSFVYLRSDLRRASDILAPS